MAAPGASPPGGRPAQQAIAAWVRQRGVLVDPNRWHPEGETVADGARPMVARLYDLGGATE